MTTVYLVTSGSYSDYSVRGAFSTRELADEFMERCHDGDWNDIEEYELDAFLPQLRAGLMPWYVVMLYNGTVERADPRTVSPYDLDEVRRNGYIWPRSTAPAYRGKGIPDALTITVLAESQEHAVKIANERRTQMIASGEWKAP